MASNGHAFCYLCADSPIITTTAILCNKATIRICRTAMLDQNRKKGVGFGQTQMKQEGKPIDWATIVLC